MFAYPFFPLTRQQLKTENNELNIYTQYLMKSTFETIWLFFHRPVGLVELLILYARVQFYTPRASDYRLNSKTGLMQNEISWYISLHYSWTKTVQSKIDWLNFIFCVDIHSFFTPISFDYFLLYKWYLLLFSLYHKIQ